MSLLDEAEALRRGPNSVCTVALLIDGLGPEEQTELREALNSSVESSALARALANRGHRIAQTTLQRHRRRECRCL